MCLISPTLRNSVISIYRSYAKTSKHIAKHGLPKPQIIYDEFVAPTGFRVSVNVKGIELKDWPKRRAEFDIATSIYQVKPGGWPPEAVCETFVVKGWRKEITDGHQSSPTVTHLAHSSLQFFVPTPRASLDEGEAEKECPQVIFGDLHKVSPKHISKPRNV